MLVSICLKKIKSAAKHGNKWMCVENLIREANCAYCRTSQNQLEQLSKLTGLNDLVNWENLRWHQESTLLLAG